MTKAKKIVSVAAENTINDVILAFIGDEEEPESQPNKTRSGRSITHRSEIEFFHTFKITVIFF